MNKISKLTLTAALIAGAGLHTTQTAGLALATDLTPPESHPKVVGLMYVMLLVGMILVGASPGGKGALIGAGVGALGGALVNDQKQKKEKEKEKEKDK